EQLVRGEKPRYDGRWRPERAKGKPPPKDRPPVIRFRTPEEGEVGWHDLVKGPIAFPNSELDDLVLLRADGVPTYNFGVVVDDLDHVPRSPAQFNPEKLAWLNQQYLKAAPDARLAPLDGDELKRRGISAENGPPLERVIALVKERASTIAQLADEATLFYRWTGEATIELEENVSKALRILKARLATVPWNRAAINDAIKEVN